MPWLLNEWLADDAEGNHISPDWGFTLEPMPPVGFRNLDFIPSRQELDIPIQIHLREERALISDYVKAPDNAGVIVSQSFREIVEALDPEPHYFWPVIIKHLNGHSQSGTHFLFRMGEFLKDALIIEQSDVSPRKTNPATMIPPRLMWCQSKVRGRHIWADKKIKKCNVVSENFLQEVRCRDLGGYVAKESRVDPSC